jgi:O-antigen/teichoic acid export membrane protein
MPAKAAASIVDSPGALRPRWAPDTLRQLVWLTLPLGLATMLNALSTHIPRLFIEHHLGRYQLGLFAAMAYLMVAGGTIVNALGQAASPRLARYHAAMDPDGFSRLLLKLVGISTLLGTSGILAVHVAGRQILTLVYRAEYAGQADVLLWLMVSAAVAYAACILGYGMTASRYFKAQPLVFAASAAVATLSCILLVPRRGLLGAAWAIVITASVQTVAVLCCNAHAVYKLYRCNACSPSKVGAI